MTPGQVRRVWREKYREIWDLYAGDALIAMSLRPTTEGTVKSMAVLAFDIADAMVEELDRRLHEGSDKVEL